MVSCSLEVKKHLGWCNASCINYCCINHQSTWQRMNIYDFQRVSCHHSAITLAHTHGMSYLPWSTFQTCHVFFLPYSYLGQPCTLLHLIKYDHSTTCLKDWSHSLQPFPSMPKHSNRYRSNIPAKHQCWFNIIRSRNRWIHSAYGGGLQRLSLPVRWLVSYCKR